MSTVRQICQSHTDIRFLILRAETLKEIFAIKGVSVVENEVHWDIDTLDSQLAAQA